MDKSVVGIRHTPKGKEYCDVPGTACCYNEHEICVNCGRPKGWRKEVTMRRKTKEPPKIQVENDVAISIGQQGGNTDQLLAMIFVRQGEILQQLQEIQANSWLR